MIPIKEQQSFSSISTFNFCPIKYDFIYNKEMRISNPVLERGSNIHEYIENKILGNETKKIDSFNSTFIDDYISELKEKYPKEKYDWFVEKEFWMDQNLRPTIEESFIHGFVDLIIVSKIFDLTPEIIIFDWKSGQYKIKEKQDWKQLFLYSQFALHNFGYYNLSNLEINYVYVDFNKLNSLNFKPDNHWFIENSLKKWISSWYEKTISFNENSFQPQEEPCQFCDFNNQCKYFQ